jgi:hypothetical protein
MRRDPDERRDCPAPGAPDSACWRRAGRPVVIALAVRRMPHAAEYRGQCGQVRPGEERRPPEREGG